MSNLLISIVVNCILFTLLAVSIFYNYKFGMIILRVQDAIEKALDEIDKSYAVMSQVLERPIFFDSVEIRQVINEIAKTRDMILRVARSLTEIEDQKE